MEEEIWKDIKDYEGIYQISTSGQIKSLERLTKTKGNSYRNVPEKILTQTMNQYGYYRVHLRKDGKDFIAMVHRLIAEAFIPNPENKPQVNHKNLIRDDNRLDNLEWMTNKENMKHAWDNNIANREAIKKATLCASIKNQKQVTQYDLAMNVIKTYSSFKQATEETKIKGSNITNVCNGKNKTAGGFIWRYSV